MKQPLLEIGSCWFCKTNPANKESVYVVEMYTNVKRRGLWSYRLTWDSKTIRVPRCKACQTMETRTSWIIYPSVFLAALVLFVPFIAWSMGAWEVSPLGWAGLCLGSLGIIFLGMLFAFKATKLINMDKHRTEQDVLKEYPLIQEFIAQGWKIGRPS